MGQAIVTVRVIDLPAILALLLPWYGGRGVVAALLLPMLGSPAHRATA